MATHFEPHKARNAFPCLDEPNLKAKFNFRIGRNESFSSLMNMPKKASGFPVEGRPGYVWDEYQESVLMPTYLVEVVVSQFDHITSVNTGNGVTWSTYARPDAIQDKLATFAATIGPIILQV